jgi:hypothetical protein
MTNALRGEAALKAGDRVFSLAFDVNAFCFAEGELKRDTDDIAGELITGTASLVVVRAMLWAALQKHHPGTHLVEAGEIMSDAGMPHVREAMIAGLSAAFGLKVAEDGDGKNPPTAEDGTGRASLRSGAKRGSSRTASGGRRRA